MMRRIAWTMVTAAALAAGGPPAAAAPPQVVNPSFEADHFASPAAGAGPGAHRGQVQGWTCTGAVWINPLWEDPHTPAGPVHIFDDNGLVPDGSQVAVLQNRCTLAQRIDGFRSGRRYRVTYYENARRRSRSPEPPELEVTLGGQTIVSRHRIQPVEEAGVHTLPYHFVESAAFVAPHDGAFELVFQSTLDLGLSVLLDKVAVEDLPRFRNRQAAAAGTVTSRRPAAARASGLHGSPPIFSAVPVSVGGPRSDFRDL